jgi:hypothetical protein
LLNPEWELQSQIGSTHYSLHLKFLKFLETKKTDEEEEEETKDGTNSKLSGVQAKKTTKTLHQNSPDKNQSVG